MQTLLSSLRLAGLTQLNIFTSALKTQLRLQGWRITMDSQAVFDWIVGIGGAIVGWALKIIWEAIKDMRLDIKDLDKQMHEDFVRRDDFKESVREIKDDMRAGFNKVDTTLGLIFKKLDERNERKTP